MVAVDENDTAAVDRKRITSNGWQQGAIIANSEKVRNFFGINNDRCDAYVLVSHSCDVLSYKYKTEPSVEFVGGLYTKKPNDMFLHRRNVRQLQLPIIGVEKPYLILQIKYRYFVDRRKLVDTPADPIKLSEDSLRELQMWMAARYQRPAFPDEFNKRIKTALTNIGDELKKNGDRGVRGLYIQIDPPLCELQQEENYEVVLMGTEEEDLEEIGSTNRRAAEDFLQYVVDQLSICEGITVSRHELVAEEGITLATLRKLKLLDFDYISLRGNTDVPELVG